MLRRPLPVLALLMAAPLLHQLASPAAATPAAPSATAIADQVMPILQDRLRALNRS